MPVGAMPRLPASAAARSLRMSACRLVATRVSSEDGRLTMRAVQATTLVIRALAIGEVRPRDWLLVLGREIQAGLALGAILGGIGFVRVTLFPPAEPGTPTELIAAVVAVSLVGIVLWGSLVGAMLPFALRRLGFDLLERDQLDDDDGPRHHGK